jgi:hypothetical protein
VGPDADDHGNNDKQEEVPLLRLLLQVIPDIEDFGLDFIVWVNEVISIVLILVF